MVLLFIGLNSANMLVLASVVTLGLLTHGQNNGTALGPHAGHVLLAIFAGMLAVFVHLTTFTYFMATSKWLAAATDKADLDPQQFIAAAWRQKRRVFKLCMLAIAATMLAMFSGAGADAAIDPTWQAQIHFLMAIVAVAANLLVAVVQYGDVQARERLMDQALGILNKPPAVLLAVCLVAITACSRGEPDPIKAGGPQNAHAGSSGTPDTSAVKPSLPPADPTTELSVHEQSASPAAAKAAVTESDSPDSNAARQSADPIAMPSAEPARLPDSPQKVTAPPLTTQQSIPTNTTADSPVPKSNVGSQFRTPSTSNVTLVETWLGRIELEHDRIKTLAASLSYDRVNLALGDRQRRFGKLIYVAGPPPRFAIHLDRMIVNMGKRNLDHWYIFDGRYLVERINDRKQIIRRQIRPDKNIQEDNPLAIGTNPFVVPLPLHKKQIMARFFIEIIPASEKDPTNTIHFHLTPKPHHDIAFKRIDIWHDRATLLPVKALTFDKSQYESEIWIKSPVVNERINTNLIDTKLPTEPGWQIEDTPLRN